MRAYVSKARVGASEAMKGAAEDALNNAVSEYEKVKAIAKVYTAKRECSFQEIVS